jgi:hypothetical protein
VVGYFLSSVLPMITYALVFPDPSLKKKKKKNLESLDLLAALASPQLEKMVQSKVEKIC